MRGSGGCAGSLARAPHRSNGDAVAGEGNRSRNKGRSGEAEVAAIYRDRGFDVQPIQRNAGGVGDHVVTYLRPGGFAVPLIVLHSEVKRCETARPWTWMAQAERDAVGEAVPVVSFRRSHGRWYALLPLEELVRLLA
jgi:hypothetical protein